MRRVIVCASGLLAKPAQDDFCRCQFVKKSLFGTLLVKNTLFAGILAQQMALSSGKTLLKVCYAPRKAVICCLFGCHGYYFIFSSYFAANFS